MLRGLGKDFWKTETGDAAGEGIMKHVNKYELLRQRVQGPPGTMIWRLHNSLGRH